MNSHEEPVSHRNQNLPGVRFGGGSPVSGENANVVAKARVIAGQPWQRISFGQAVMLEINKHAERCTEAKPKTIVIGQPAAFLEQCKVIGQPAAFLDQCIVIGQPAFLEQCKEKLNEKKAELRA